MYRGFFKSHGDSLFTPILQSLEKDVNDIIYQSIYNEWDIKACLNNRVSEKKGKFYYFIKKL